MTKFSKLVHAAAKKLEKQIESLQTKWRENGRQSPYGWSQAEHYAVQSRRYNLLEYCKKRLRRESFLA